MLCWFLHSFFFQFNFVDSNLELNNMVHISLSVSVGPLAHHYARMPGNRSLQSKAAYDWISRSIKLSCSWVLGHSEINEKKNAVSWTIDCSEPFFKNCLSFDEDERPNEMNFQMNFQVNFVAWFSHRRWRLHSIYSACIQSNEIVIACVFRFHFDCEVHAFIFGACVALAIWLPSNIRFKFK